MTTTTTGLTPPTTGPDAAAAQATADVAAPPITGPGEVGSPSTGPLEATAPATAATKTTPSAAGSGASTTAAAAGAGEWVLAAGGAGGASPLVAGSGVSTTAAAAAAGAVGEWVLAAGGPGEGAVPVGGSSPAPAAPAAPVVSVVPACLADLVGEVEAFFCEHWANQPVVLRARCDLSGLITEQEMWDEVDCGLLSRPYFTVFNEGVRTAISDMTRTRRVVGHELPGFIEPERIRADFAAGATFKFNQAEHWHPRIRALVKAMEPHFSGGLEAFVFLSPPGKTAMQAHTDGAHVFILQVAGVKDWVVGRIDAASTSDSTLHEGPIADASRREMTLRPGDVLYMPHGTPHYATAREGNSIHVAITIEEPTAENLAEVLLAGFLGSAAVTALHERHHAYRLGERTELLRRALVRYLRDVDEEAVTAAAVTLRRQHR